VGVVVLETFAGIVRVSPGHISLGRGALRRSSVCFDVTRGKGEGGVVAVVAACAGCY